MVDIPHIEPIVVGIDPTAAAFAALDRAAPIALLPVRLETRWFAAAAATELELRVRVYPDAIHLVRSAGGMQTFERDAAITYWQVRKVAGDDAPATATAWDRLASAVGEARARWLSDQLTPSRGADGAPVFPDVLIDDAPGLPEAQALPDRFVILGYEQGARLVTAWSAPVPHRLAVGPVEPGAGDDPGRRWQVDFVEAERVGMATRVRMPREVAARLTRIVVLGVRSSENAAAGGGLLGELIEAHGRDGGASLLAPGTPTNHTTSRRPAALDGTSGAVPGPDSDGARLAGALGVGAERLRHVAGAAARWNLAARAMHVATWPATWGYFLEHIVGPTVSAEQRAAGRRLFVEHVRGHGPFAALCLGRQPYGILPVTALSRWRTDAGGDDAFARGLHALLPRWVASGRRAAHLPASGDPMPALLDLLAQQPTSVRWFAREAATPEIAGSWWLAEALEAVALARLLEELRKPIEAELTQFGLLPRPGPVRIDPRVHADQATALDLPLVRAVRAAGGTAYVAAMAENRDLEVLRRHQLPGASPRSLLYMLLRHATLLVAARATDDVLAIGAVAREEPDVRADPADTLWTRLSRPAPAFGGRSAREMLGGERLPVHPIFSELTEHRGALTALAERTVPELELLTAEVLDVSSHRLDAWVTAIATRRLMSRREAAGSGTHVGAYAWVEAPPVPATPARDGVPVIDPGHGRVHAPSLDHARTAAVLRAGFVARPGGDLAVELSSRRVRAARWLLAGLHAGRSLSELLGYRIEKVLADADDIAAARGLFPLAGSGGDPSAVVLDGLAAYQAWRGGAPARFERAADDVRELVDGVSDLLLAESVHQHVSGNADRAAVVLEALAAGTVVPPDPAVAQTVIESERTAWQVAISVGEHVADGWPGDADRVRARANPAINAWLARILGAPQALAATVRYRAADGAPGELGRTAADLELCPLDLAALAGSTLASGPLLALFAAEAPAGATEIAVTPSPALATGHLLARAFVELVRHARPWSAGNDEPLLDGDPAGALATLDALVTANDERTRRRLAAVLGAPAIDPAAARNLVSELSARVRGAASPAEQIRALSGVTAVGRAPLAADAAGDVLATPSQQLVWLADLGRVRPAIAALATLGHGATGRPSLSVHRTDGKLLVVAGAHGAEMRGIVIDTWTEATPRPTTTTGVAFHHDAPRARAPQAIWLAVPPNPRAAWSLATLEATVDETIELMTARLATPHEVWGPLLPATYFAENLDDETVSSTFNDVAVDVVARES